jgi:hypothetical protein
MNTGTAQVLVVCVLLGSSTCVHPQVLVVPVLLVTSTCVHPQVLVVSVLLVTSIWAHPQVFVVSVLLISPSDFNETFFNMLHMNSRTRPCRHICLGKYKMNGITLMNGIVG